MVFLIIKAIDRLTTFSGKSKRKLVEDIFAFSDFRATVGQAVALEFFVNVYGIPPEN